MQKNNEIKKTNDYIKGGSHRPLPATALPQQTCPIQMGMEIRPPGQCQQL